MDGDPAADPDTFDRSRVDQVGAAPLAHLYHNTSVIARSSISPWTRLAAILLGTFVGTLGNSVSNVALPAVMAEFTVPLSSAVWVVSAYTLAFAVLMPVCGYSGDLYGQRRMYLWGMALFAAASVGSGLAPSFPWLVGSRVLLGIAIAPTLPAVMAMIAHLFSPEHRGRAIGFWALTNGAGHALGPPLSGFLVEYLSWRAVFLFSLPLCLLNLYLVWRLAPPDDIRTQRGFDLGGAGMLTTAALGLMLALTQGARWGWNTPLSLGLWALTLAALVAFVIIERRVASPFVELDLFANRHYASAAVVIAAQFFCLFGLLLTLPVFLIQSQGWSSQAAGMLILPLPLTMALIAPLAGRLSDARGSRWTCTVGMGLVALAGLAMLELRPASNPVIPWWALAGSLVIAGTGMGLTQSPSAATVTHVVEPSKLGVATGVFHMCRFVSGSLGSTAFGLVLETSPTGVAGGFQRDLLALLVISVLTMLVAQALPSRPTSSTEPAGS